MKKFILALTLILVGLAAFIACSLPQTLGLNNPNDPSSSNFGSNGTTSTSSTSTVPPPSWKFVGSPVSAEAANAISIVVDGETPIVAFNEGTAAAAMGKLAKFDANTWTAFTPPFSATGTGPNTNITLAKSPSDNSLVVAYRESTGPLCKRWTGAAWQTLGGAIFDVVASTNLSMTLDGSGNPIVAYERGADGYVKRWDGSSWGAAYKFVAGASPSSIDTEIAAAGYVQVFFADQSLPADGKGKVVISAPGGPSFGWPPQDTSPTSWASNANSFFSTGSVNSISSAIDGNDTFIACVEPVTSTLTVCRPSGSGYAVDATRTDAAGPAKIAAGTNYNRFLAYKTTLGKISAMRTSSGYQFIDLGLPNFGPGVGDSLSLAISATGVPYVAFNDPSDGGRVKVMKFD